MNTSREIQSRKHMIARAVRSETSISQQEINIDFSQLSSPHTGAQLSSVSASLSLTEIDSSPPDLREDATAVESSNELPTEEGLMPNLSLWAKAFCGTPISSPEKLEVIEGGMPLPQGKVGVFPSLTGCTAVIFHCPNTKATYGVLLVDLEFEADDLLLEAADWMAQASGNNLSRCQVFVTGNAPLTKSFLQTSWEVDGDRNALLMLAAAQFADPDAGPDDDLNDTEETRPEFIEDLVELGFSASNIHTRWAKENENISLYFDPVQGTPGDLNALQILADLEIDPEFFMRKIREM